ncbi:hypothetical protein BH20ACI2_BH20ACI2_21660 [soil metagenome]
MIMKPTKIISAFLTVVFLLHSVPAILAFETDQYNLPPEPLADIADEINEYVARQLRLAAAGVNARIAAAETCLASKASGCDRPEQLKKELEYLRSEPVIGQTIYELLGGGHLMTTKFGKWIHSHTFRAQPASYKAPYLESIYLIKPSNYVTLSATIRMYGHEFGIDKLEHLFQQGHQYYDRVNEAAKDGEPPEQAVKKAIEWGKRTERTYYGILTSGVYSNADLHANYVGLKFYEGLTKPIEIAGSVRPAMFGLKQGRWLLADDKTLRGHLLKPFISDHLNEAFNPSAFRITLVSAVKRSVKKNSCHDWTNNFPDLTAKKLSDRARSLELWNGEDYGHTKRRGFVNIGEICFSAGISSAVTEN